MKVEAYMIYMSSGAIKNVVNESKKQEGDYTPPNIYISCCLPLVHFIRKINFTSWITILITIKELNLNDSMELVTVT